MTCSVHIIYLYVCVFRAYPLSLLPPSLSCLPSLLPACVPSSALPCFFFSALSHKYKLYKFLMEPSQQYMMLGEGTNHHTSEFSPPQTWSSPLPYLLTIPSLM